MSGFPVFWPILGNTGSLARHAPGRDEPRPEKPLLDDRSLFSGAANLDTEVRGQTTTYANAVLSTAAATLPAPAHWTAHRESAYGIFTEDGAFGRRSIPDSEWAWLGNFQSSAACAGRDLILEILPDFVEARTRDAGPTPDGIFETMASRAAKGVSKPHLYCWEYFLRWRVAEMARVAHALEAGGIKVSGWLIVNEADGGAPNAKLSRGPGVREYDIAHTSVGTRGPYAFSFAVTDGTDIEVYVNQIKQAATSYDVTAAAVGGFGMGGTITIKSTSAAPAAGVIVTIRRPARTVQFTSVGGASYSFAFAVSKDTDVEVRVNGVELARNAFSVAAASGGYVKGGIVTLGTAPASGATVVIRRAGYTGYLTDAYTSGGPYSNADLAARTNREYQRTTVIGRIVEMCRIMHEELRGEPPRDGVYVQDGGTPRAGERWFNNSGKHDAPVLGPIPTRCGSGAYPRPGATDLLAGGTLWTIYDFLAYNGGEALEYLGNGGKYPVIDTHAHHYYNFTRNFDGVTFGGGEMGGNAIDARDISKFQTMDSVQYTVPAANRAGPYAFTFPVSAASAIEVWVDNVKTGCTVIAASGGFTNGGSVTFATAPAAGATVLIRAGLSQYAQITQSPEHIAAAFQLANAKRAAAGKPIFPGFVSYHTESGLGTTTGAATATLPPVDATVPGQTDMSQAEQARRCGTIVGGYLVGSTWTGGWGRSFLDTRITPNARYEPEQMVQMLRAYRWHQIVLGSLWYGEAHKCTYAWTGSVATDRMNFVYNSDIFKQGGAKGDWNPNSGSYPTNPALHDSWRVSADGSFDGVIYKINDTITCTATSPVKWAKGVVWGAAFTETYTMQVVRKLFNHTRFDIKNGIAIVGKPRFVFGDPNAVQCNDLATWGIWTCYSSDIGNATYDPPNCPCPEWNRVTFADNLLTFAAAPTNQDNRAGRPVHLRETGEHVVRVTAQVSSISGRAALILRGFDNTNILAESSAYTPVGATSEVRLEARFTHKPHGMSGIHDPHRVGIFLRHNGIGTATFKDATIEPV